MIVEEELITMCYFVDHLNSTYWEIKCNNLKYDDAITKGMDA